MNTGRVIAVVILFLASAACFGAQEPSAHKLTIRLAQTDEWKAPLKDVEKLLASAGAQLWMHFPERDLAPVIVDPKGGPITLYQRGQAGEYRIRLNTSGLFWSQYAYQFAHEFCHVLCNCRPGDSANKWFEESLCEMASIYALRSMARAWRTDAPYPNWREYSPKLEQYAQDLIDKAQLPSGVTLSGWMRENLPALRKDAGLREKNRIVAVALLPIFEKSPEHWEAIAYLNAADNGTTRSFEVFLADWHAQVPRKHKAFVRELAEKMGAAIPK